MTTRILWLSFLLSFTACATDRMFAPREYGNGVGPSGAPAALYPLAAPLQGEVRLWSDGARLETTAGAAVCVLHVGFEFENTSAAAWEFDTADVRLVDLRGADDQELAVPTLRGGERTFVQPGATARSHLEYAFAPEVEPRSIRTFAVHWRLRAGEEVQAQVTPFEPYRRQSADFAEPWPWWGFGFGFGWHHCR